MKLVPLPGSERAPIPAAVVFEKTQELLQQLITITAVFDKHTPEEPYSQLIEYAEGHGLLVGLCPGHRVKIRGPVEVLCRAFKVELRGALLDTKQHLHRIRAGAIHVPEEVAPYLIAILGFDNRPVAHPNTHRHASPQTSFNPADVARIYDIPFVQGNYGKGQTIAVLELGGGYKDSDLITFFQPYTLRPDFAVVEVDGATNNPSGDPNSADGEVALDLEVAGGIACQAQIVAYFAPNTDQGFVDCIIDVATDTTYNPSVLSISWGGPEDQWTAQAIKAMNQALQLCAAKGITVTVAAGDSGYTDGESTATVDFPASSPFVLACGGTTLTAQNNQYVSEVVWGTNDPAGTVAQNGGTGGGFSAQFPLPAYQATADTKGAGGNGLQRGVPDVCGNADPATGWNIFVAGQWGVIGGTSAVAPMWAATVAILNNIHGRRMGFMNPMLYANPSLCRPVTEGNNGFFQARNGWSACCGLGSPDGTELAK